MTKDISNKLFALAHGAKSIAITTHIHSDGDGMVAAFALQEILRIKGLASIIITDGEDLSRYSFLMDNAVHQAYQEGMNYELVMVLDCNGRDRLGQRAALLDAARKIFVLDHHVPEHGVIEADLQVVDSHYVSAGAMVYRLFEHEILSFEPEERKFIADGFGVKRFPVMYNDFIIVGPKSDPAGVKGKDVVEALKKVSAANAPFVSRGDKSGTHAAELGNLHKHLQLSQADIVHHYLLSYR